MADMDPLADILNGTAADATDVQANFQIVETYINGTNLIRADGTEVMTANLDMDGNKVVNLAAGTVTGNAVEYDQMNTAIGVLSGVTSALPLGVVAYSLVTSTQALSSVLADVTGITGTWTATASRLYRVEFSYGLSYVSGSAGTSTVYLTDSSNNQKSLRTFLTNASTSSGQDITMSAIVTGLSGSVTWKARHQMAASTNYTTTCSATAPGFFIVEDVGLA